MASPDVLRWMFRKRITAVDASGALNSVSDFSVATDKLTVAAASGNTAIAGTLAVTGNVAVNTDKFTVAAASGNTLVAGTLAVTGASTLTGALGVTAAITPTGGIVGTSPIRIPNIPIGAVAYASLGTSTTPVAGTIYISEVFLPVNKTIAGIGILNGATVGTDAGIVGLYSAAGALLANSALAGATTSGTNAFQEFAFTTPYAAVGPNKYFIAYQVNGTTTRFRSIATNTYLNTTKSTAGVFGTLGAQTPPTTTTADVGPIGYLYSAA